MSYKVTYLRGLETRDSNWFVLLWNDIRANSTLSKRAVKLVDSIHGSIGKKVIVARSDTNADAQGRIRDDLLKKPWPEVMKERLEKTEAPVILVWERNFDVFNPQQDNWFAIFLDRVGAGTSLNYVEDRLISETTRAATSQALFDAFDQIAAKPFAPFNVDGCLMTRHHVPERAIAGLPIQVARRGRPPNDWGWFRDAFTKLPDGERAFPKTTLARLLIDRYRASGADGKAPALKTLVKKWSNISGEE